MVIIPNAFAEEQVPDWIKNTAGWWADALISNSEFVNAIEFLIKEGIIHVDTKAVSEKSDNIPDWVRNTAGWWATDLISETEFINAIQFMIESGLISISKYNCDQNEDLDRNNIPDMIEEAIVISELPNDVLRQSTHPDIPTEKFENKNWSYCYFPKDLSFYTFENTDLSYSDFSDAKLFHTMFNESNLQGADFSNTNIQGSVFWASDLSYTNFENADFSSDNWEEPFLTFTYKHKMTEKNELALSVSELSCYFIPCWYYSADVEYYVNDFYTMTFGKNEYPFNLKLVDRISDESDNRSIWRHHPMFLQSEMLGTIFTESDLAYATFAFTEINNVDFTDANLSNTFFQNVNFTNVKSADDILNGSIGSEGITYPPDVDISKKKFEPLHNLSGDFNIVFDYALDHPPINWSMGMTIYDERLYVADTDNHRIIVYNLENNEKLLAFSSPIQGLEIKNLPSSIVVIEEKIFVAYGWADHIQVFDLNGNYLWKFGSSGTQAGQFNTPFRLAALNNELFVADLENHRIQIFDLDGNFLWQFKTYNDSTGQLSKPLDVYPYGSQIFVVDQIKASILVFDLNGKFMKEFPVNQDLSNTSEPYGIFVYDDLIFVSDIGDSSIKIFDLDGNIVKQFGQYGDRYGEFKHPNLAITDGNRIFASDAENYRIQIFKITP